MTDTPTPKDDPRAFAAELAADLRTWLEWAALTGTIEMPSTPAAELAAAESPPPRVPAQRPASVPATAPIPPRTTAQRPASAEPPSAQVTPPSSPMSRSAPSTPSRAITPRAAASAHPVSPPPSTPVGQGEAGLKQVRDELGDCQRCRLAKDRKQIVYGVGNPNADLVLVGEAPGQQEDLTGEPFVGRAGQLLTRMLATIGLGRDQVYICNVIKCRPPQNRDPLPDEVGSCSPFLHRQIRAVDPKVIMTLGRFAATTVVGVDGNLGELRKRLGSWNGVPIVPTYHPSYLLRTPHMKRAAWEDLLVVRRLLRDAANPG